MDDCIIWCGAINSSGYGVVWLNGRMEYAHRIAAKANKGDVVLHSCDCKSCVNPNHLKVGTYQDNSSDMVSKNRQAKGEKAGNSKLSDIDVFIIRDLNGNTSSRNVAKAFGISKTNVLDIWRRAIWRHI